ncbi:MAG TPA: alpha/beta hydrolase [Pseudomonas sp.]|uniref:alpha/beta hydrolase family protein n=1 Tax=Pseudomonas sp. TaxID=306 RepID=UPI000EE31609|nr:alpha/beta fold hydrolase [Pseudomonas sp.]HCN64729.1 alpha/beta hydrolase [Pseudomonas sp.]
MHDEHRAVEIQVVQFPARDARLLTGTLYTPLESNARSVLINGATAVKRGYYDSYARYLASAGFSVLTYDYRGIGDSRDRPTRTERMGMRAWGEADAAGAIDFLKQLNPEHRLIVVGHSAGGQLFGLADNNACAVALMTVSSQSGYWRHWPWPRRVALAGLWYFVMPALTWIFSYFPARRLGLGSTDLPPGVAREWARWCRHPDYIVDDAGQPLRQHFQGYQGKILAHTVSDDWMAPPGAVLALLGFYSSAQIEFRELSAQTVGTRSLGHFGYFRSTNRALWPAGVEWLRAQ